MPFPCKTLSFLQSANQGGCAVASTQEQTCLTEHLVSQLLSGAPLLEKLELGFMDMKGNISIESTSLKKLQIGTDAFSVFKAVLRIRAPNLLSLEFSCVFYGSCFLDVVFCFKEPFDDEVSGRSPPIQMFHQIFESICHVQKVTLSTLSLQFLVEVKKEGMVVEFTEAKCLNLHPNEANQLLGVVDMFPHLTTLHVELDKDWYEILDRDFGSPPRKATLPSPSLLSLKTANVTWYMRDPSIIPAIEIILENADGVSTNMVWR